MIAKIAVAAANFAIDKPYSYRIPFGMALTPGVRVSVPFGAGNRRTEGIVLALEEREGLELKPVAEVLDQEPLLTESMLRLAAFMRSRYFCTFYEAARAMLPSGLWFRVQVHYDLSQDRSWKAAGLRQKDAALLLERLEAMGGTAEEQTLRGDMEEEAFHRAVSYLLRKKWLETGKDYHGLCGEPPSCPYAAFCAADALRCGHGGGKGALLFHRCHPCHGEAAG